LKLAYFIAAHRNPAQLFALGELLSASGDIVLVHVDARADPAVHEAARRLQSSADVRILPPRPIHWGGWSMARLLMDALGELCVAGLDWDYLVNLSGQDMPVRPVSELRDFLRAHEGANFVDCRPIEDLPEPLRTIVRRRYRWLALELGGRARRLPVPVTGLHRGRIRYYGSQWVMLSRAFCDWAAATPLEQAGCGTLNLTFIPDEFLIQQMIMSGPYRDTLVPDNRRFVRFTGDAHPRVLRLEDMATLERSDAFFARKFDPAVDEAVLGAITRRIAA
jgi:hypothetical protein